MSSQSKLTESRVSRMGLVDSRMASEAELRFQFHHDSLKLTSFAFDLAGFDS